MLHSFQLDSREPTIIDLREAGFAVLEAREFGRQLSCHSQMGAVGRWQRAVLLQLRRLLVLWERVGQGNRPGMCSMSFDRRAF